MWLRVMARAGRAGPALMQVRVSRRGMEGERAEIFEFECEPWGAGRGGEGQPASGF